MPDAHTYFSEEYPEPQGCFRALLSCIAALAIVIFLVAVFTSCATTKCMPEKEYVTRDSIVYRWHSDTTIIYEKDSTYIDRSKDTILIIKWKEKTTEHISTHNDSTANSSQTDEVQKETIEVIPTYYRNCSWIMWCLIAAIGVYAVIKIFIRIYVKR